MKWSHIVTMAGLTLIIIGGFVVAMNQFMIWHGQSTGADEISCNWLFCTVTYTSEECFRNGTEIPCEKLKEMEEWTLDS